MRRVGLVSVDNHGLWLGGRYYLQHQIRAVASLSPNERLPICDVWWGSSPAEDHFAEVRADIGASVVIDFPKTRLGRLGRRFRRFVAGIDDARDLLEQNEIGVLFPTLPFERPGVPFVYWLPDFQHIHLRSELSESISAVFESRITWSVRLADLVVLSSEACLQDFVEAYPEAAYKARLLRFCSAPTQEWWALDPAVVTKLYRLERPYFLLSNQFNYYKNHRVVFEAMDMLKQRGLDAELVCTGSIIGFKGEQYYLDLKKFVEERGLDRQIRILGMLPRQEQISLLRAATAVLQPSRYEGWSTAVEDARALNKPILASDIAVHREQLGNDYPYLLPLADPGAWVEAMAALLANVERTAVILSRHEVESMTQNRQREAGRAFVSIMREAMDMAS